LNGNAQPNKCRNEETVSRIAEPVEATAQSQLVDRVLASRHFVKAPLLSAFLRYAYQRSFEEGAGRVSEQEIGVNVFHRDKDYDSREDNIVRNYARQLRKRLDEYYATEGSQERIRITFPKGGYIPVFVPLGEDQAHNGNDVNSALPESRTEHTRGAAEASFESKQRIPRQALLPYRVLSISCFVLATIVAFLLFAVLHPYRKKERSYQGNAHPLWNRIFQPNVTTTWVSLDSGLVLMSIAARKDVSLEEYIRRDFHRQTKDLSPKEASEALTFAYRRYTDFVEVEMVHRFDTETAVNRGNFVVKFARDVRVNDLRLGNAILHGAPFANPWVEMYEPEMNFIGMLDFEGRGDLRENRGFHFENKHPKPNEPSRYSILWNDAKQPLLGSVAFLPGLDKKGVVLIVQGSSLAASEAVQDYLLNDDAFLPFLKSIRKPDGTLPFFEVVLESHEVDGTPGSCNILTSRIY
jgi:hypothetical protein